MFFNESELQGLVDLNPSIISNALMEISQELNASLVPKLFSLGREIALNSGYLDNLFIDAQGIITIVECKLYSNSGLKREVYSQAVNYAADIQTQLRNCNDTPGYSSFQTAFTELLLRNSQYDDFQAMMEDIKCDPFLNRYKKDEWEYQFNKHLKKNIEQGVFRIVIACGPHQTQGFHLSNIQNVMRIMQFSERGNNSYDLSLIDVRGGDSSWVSKAIWRRYFDLPQVPFIFQSSRNTTAKIEEVNSLVNAWPQKEQRRYLNLLELLNQSEISAIQTTQGLALYYQDRSLYTEFIISSTGFCIRRVQIDPSGWLGGIVSTEEIHTVFDQFGIDVKRVKSTANRQGFKYHIVLTLSSGINEHQIKEAIYRLTGLT